MTKVTICAIAKNEERYIEDWLKYHYELGFDNITIYDNNIPERRGELRTFINKSTKLTPKMIAATEVIDATGKIGYQPQAYNEYYKRGGFDWCAFIDIDEFITLVKWKNIKDRVNDSIFDNTTAIYLIWDTISDDNIVDVPDNFVYNGMLAKDITDPSERERAADEWEKIPVYDRFKIPRNTYDAYIGKILLRGGVDDINIVIHHINSKKAITKNVFGRICVNNPVRYNQHEVDRVKNIAYIRHYRTKTIREYLRQKYLNKTDADNSSKRTLFVEDYFFLINERTLEKVKYYNTYHQPIILNILSEDSKTFNHNALYYMPNNYKNRRNTFLITIEMVKRYINSIDRITVI